jgi:hypothetical protein
LKSRTKKKKVRKVNPDIKRAKGKDTILTLSSLLVFRRAPVPTGHLALSRRKVDLRLVQGEVPLSEQSFQPSDLALIPLSGRPLPLGLLGQVADPLLQRSNLFPGLPSLSHEGRTLLPKLSRNLAFFRKFPLGRLPGNLLIFAGCPGVPFPVEEN